MAASAKVDGTLVVPLDKITVVEGFNARILDPQDASLDGLVTSIEKQGVIVPLIVTEGGNGDDYLLVAGHRRFAAASRAGLTEVPVVLRTAETAEADAAIENVSRSQLTALEEGRAIKALIDNGYTAEGAADALGASAQSVHNRLRLMGLPEEAREFFGPGGNLRPGHVDTLAAVATVSPDVAVIAAQRWNESPQQDVGWLMNRDVPKGLYPAHTRYQVYDTEYHKKEISLGAKHSNMAKEMREKVHGYERDYEPMLGELEFDAARAAGVLIEFERYAFVTDKAMMVDLLKRRIEADHAAWKERPKDTKAKAAAKTSDPKAEAKKAARATLRDLQVQAQGVNLELGAALLDNLASVDVTMDVARFWVYGLLRSEGMFRDDGKVQTGYGSTFAAMVGASGIRLVIGDLRTEERQFRKDGTPGKLKITYATMQDTEGWVWRFLDGAKTPEQLFGRGLVLFAASRYAERHAVTRALQTGDQTPAGYKDKASKALDALAKKHLPASHKSLTKAIEKAEAEARALGL